MLEWLTHRLGPARVRRWPHAPAPYRHHHGEALPAPGGADALDDPAAGRVLGCGWFDSSHDLRAGLVVREHASADAVAEALTVADWLELHLREWRGGPAMAASSGA